MKHDIVTASFATRQQADDAVARLRSSGFGEVELSVRATTDASVDAYNDASDMVQDEGLHTNLEPRFVEGVSGHLMDDVDDTVDFVDPDASVDNMVKGSDMGIAASGRVYGTGAPRERYVLTVNARRHESDEIKALMQDAGADRVDIHRI